MEQGQEQKASAAIEALKSEATELTREARRASGRILEQRVDKFFSIFDDIEGAVRAAARELENGQHPRLAQYVNRAAEEAANVRARFRGAEVGQLISTAESVARTHPAAVLGAAFAAGFAFVRLLKDTAPTGRRGDDMGYEGDYDKQTPYSTRYEPSRSQYGSEARQPYRAESEGSVERSRYDDPAESREDI
jgi:hypothetical protein